MFRIILDTIKRIDSIRKRYLVMVIGIFLLFAFILSSIFALHFDKINNIHAISARNQIIEMKKDFLEDIVNNTIRYIDEMKEIHGARLKKRIEMLLIFIEEHSSNYDIEHMQDYIESSHVNENLSIMIIDKLDQVIYKSPTALKYLSSELSGDYFIYEEINFDNHTIIIGALDSCLKSLVEESLRNRIYNDLYFEDSYIWVNEVIDYNGGNEYAIRLIHPNLKDTEGMFLSTDMEDIGGGKPYFEELEGIKNNGEIFFTYYFKKLTTDNIEKKITFAKLYDDYDWVIAMGIYNDNIEEYITKATNETSKEKRAALNLIVLSSFTLIIIGTAGFLFAESSYYKKSTEPLITQVSTDLLTGAGSRRAAHKTILKAFNDFKVNGGLYTLIIVDLDDFKKLNDEYGHAVGDKVLISVVASIKKVIREEDKIFRWGGEEFVIFAKGIMPENLDIFIEKILNSVDQSAYIKDDQLIKTTISIGATHFIESDESYDSALKRADDALYKSKGAGKNKGTKLF